MIVGSEQTARLCNKVRIQAFLLSLARVPFTFNQGVTGSRPVRPTKASKPTQLRSFEKNQGVKTLGQPTP